MTKLIYASTQGRLGTGFDIAMAAVYLSSDGSGSYVSGNTIVVDGAGKL